MRRRAPTRRAAPARVASLTTRPPPPHCTAPHPVSPPLFPQGGAAFARGDLDDAIAAFGRAVALAPASATALASRANRAAALLKAGRWGEAEADCSAILAQLALGEGDEAGATARRKALFRRASARAQLDLRREAAADVALLLAEEPGNAAALALKARLEA